MTDYVCHTSECKVTWNVSASCLYNDQSSFLRQTAWNLVYICDIYM